MWSAINSISSIGTTLIETTEQYAKELAKAPNSPTPSQQQPLISAESSPQPQDSQSLQEALEQNKKLSQTLDTLRSKAKSKIQELQDQNTALAAENAKIKEELKVVKMPDTVLSDSNHSADEINGLHSTIDALKQELAKQQASDLVIEDLQMQLAQTKNQLHLNTASFEDQLRTLQTQLLAATQQQGSSDLELTLNEKNEYIVALEKQIEGLHKSNSQIRVKDAEISRLSEMVDEQKRSLAALQNSINSKDGLIKGLQEKLVAVETKSSLELQQMREEWQILEGKCESLKQSADQSEKLLSQQTQLQNDITAKDDEINSLRVSLDKARKDLEEKSSVESQFEASHREQEESKALLKDLQNQLSQALIQVDENRAELSRKEEQLNDIRLELEREREESAHLISKHARELENSSKDLQSKQQELRALQSELNSCKQTLLSLETSKSTLENLLAESQKQHQNSSLELAKLRREHESTLSKFQSELELLNETLNKKDAEIVQINDIERLHIEWRDKLRILEQENYRLRDRTLRAEKILADMERDRISGTNDGQIILASPIQFMKNIRTLSWLATKDEDDYDPEAPRSDRRMSGGNQGAKIQHLMRNLVRKVLRTIDQESVRFGILFRDNPAARLGMSVYVLALHALIISSLFSAIFRGSTPHED